MIIRRRPSSDPPDPVTLASALPIPPLALFPLAGLLEAYVAATNPDDLLDGRVAFRPDDTESERPWQYGAGGDTRMGPPKSAR